MSPFVKRKGIDLDQKIKGKIAFLKIISNVSVIFSDRYLYHLFALKE